MKLSNISDVPQPNITTNNVQSDWTLIQKKSSKSVLNSPSS